MLLQVRVAMHCDRQRHASNVLTYLSEPIVIVLYNEPRMLAYIYIINCPSITKYAYYLYYIEGCARSCYVNDSCWSSLSCWNCRSSCVEGPPAFLSALHCYTNSARLMLGPLTAHTFALWSWPSPPKQDTIVATRPVPPLVLTLMYFSINVMFLTQHSNSTIYLSTRLPCMCG